MKFIFGEWCVESIPPFVVIPLVCIFIHAHVYVNKMNVLPTLVTG